MTNTAPTPKPLAGWRVLVPRGGPWGDSVAADLRSKGASPIVAAMINFAPTADAPALEAALARLANGDLVLPQSSRYRARRADDRGMRFSFVSIEHADGTPRLVAGEYGDGSRTDRAARFTLDGEVELHEPGLYRMQGIVIVDHTWYVTTSNGEKTGGDLWVGRPGAFVRHRHVLPAGPEDLAYDRRTGRLWSLSEWPGRRRVFQIDPRRLR